MLLKHALPVMLKTLLVLCLLAQHAHGQEKKRENVLLHPQKFYRKYMPGLKIKPNPPDTNYIKTYPNYLSVGMHILSPAIQMKVRPRGNNAPDISSAFRTNITDVLGFSVNYRYIAAGFAFLMNTGMNMHSNYARSHYRTATIKYSNAGRSFQFKYIRIRGFTDVRQAGNRDQRYVRRPDMISKEYQFEGIQNFNWRKYSYIAPLTFAQRQIKSHAGFLLKGGAFYTEISGDSALLNARQQPYYKDLAGARVLRTVALRIAPGIGYNYVHQHSIYFSIVVFTSPDLYFYKYLETPTEERSAQTRIIFVLDTKAGLGYHTRRFYAGLRYELEHRAGPLQGLLLSNTYQYTGIELGYRFNAPKIVKKVYKATMPPGM